MEELPGMAPKALMGTALTLAVIAFGPALLALWGFLGPIWLFSVSDSLRAGAVMAPASDLMVLTLLSVLPLAVTFLFPLLALRQAHRVARGLLLYAGMMVMALSIAFMLSASLAGVSMAVVDGVVSGWELLGQELVFALSLLLPLQLLVVPWTIFSTWLSFRLARPTTA
jgi:hypothetical protein